MDMCDSKVLFENAGGVMTVTMNRPEKHNALDREMRGALLSGFLAAGADPDVRAMVLRGVGPSFCSGQDVREPKPEIRSRRAAIWAKEQENLAQVISELPFPVVASLHGNVIGRGLDLALAADVRVAAPDSRLSYPEVDHGMLLSGGGMRRLGRIVGESRASEMVLCGTRLDVSTAHAWGLVTRLAAQEEVDVEAAALAAELAGKAPLAMYLAKKTVRDACESSAAAGGFTDTAFNVVGIADAP